jgi:hypothetical protein
MKNHSVVIGICVQPDEYYDINTPSSAKETCLKIIQYVRKLLR